MWCLAFWEGYNNCILCTHQTHWLGFIYFLFLHYPLYFLCCDSRWDHIPNPLRYFPLFHYIYICGNYLTNLSSRMCFVLICSLTSIQCHLYFCLFYLCFFEWVHFRCWRILSFWNTCFLNPESPLFIFLLSCWMLLMNH